MRWLAFSGKLLEPEQQNGALAGWLSARQLKRGRQIVAHNEEVARSGVGERLEERATDFSEGLARNRYRVFKEQTYNALVSLREIFHYHFTSPKISEKPARSAPASPGSDCSRSLRTIFATETHGAAA